MKGLLGTAGAVLFLAAACGGASSAGTTLAQQAGGNVAVTVTDNSITALPATLGAGKATFTVKNTGTVVHSIVLLQTETTHDKIPADPKDASKVVETGKVGESGQIQVSQSKDFAVDLKPGKYVILCNEPAHYLLGMHIAFTVK